MIMISACLMGEKCRYDGGSKPCEKMISKLRDKEYVMICPEVEGGMIIPRKPCEILGGDGETVLSGRAKVVSEDGEDMTDYYIRGAQKVLKKAEEIMPEEIILKSKSPSCGCGLIHSGSFDGKLKNGDGVTAALLKKNGFSVKTEEEE